MIESRETVVRPGWREYGQRAVQLAWRVPPLAVFLGLLLLFFNKMAFSNLILARGDTFLYFYPYWDAAAEALRNGRIPLWNPNLFMGVPFLANSQVGFFYPLNWPLWLLLPTPYAVSASILLHLFIAGCGAYFAAKRALWLSEWPATVTAVLFALGGYLTAQVEHINQLQGLAWMPWFLVVLAYAAEEKYTSRVVVVAQSAVALAFLFGMQLLAGHTQTTFITGVMVVVWGAAQFVNYRLLVKSPEGLRWTFYWDRFRRRVPLALLVGGGLALLMTAVQFVPTLELSQFSSRQGGLPPNEVMSFSLHPLLLAQTLLPGYGHSLFSEYVALLPLTALALAFVGAWQWRRWRGVLPTVALAMVGLLLALGLFNPLYWLLARLPGFDLFRVPARWLAVYTLGVALLAGLGWQVCLDRWQLRTQEWGDLPERARENLWHVERPLRLALFVILGLILWNFVANLLSFFVSTGAEAPYEPVRSLTVFLWLAELLILYFVLIGQRLTWNPDSRFKLGVRRGRLPSPWLLLPLLAVVLFAATRTHPYNNLTTPEAYFGLRPPIVRLLAAAPCRTVLAEDASCALPPDRFLSLSDIFFDVGDQGELNAIYADQLSGPALYDYTVAVKHKEIIGPNLPLAYGLASVDGFDGGILPLRAYSQVMQLILPRGVTTTDGRLREHLSAVPAAKWLDLFNGRYVITDKVGDAWREIRPGHGVFFDLEHPLILGPDESFSVAYVPEFTATAVALVAEGEVGIVELTSANGEVEQLTPFAVTSGLLRAGWPVDFTRQLWTEVTPQTITFHGPAAGEWRILGATLLHEGDDTFQPLTLGQYRLIHSGDVKIYENLDVLPRAFMVHDWQWQPDVAAGVAAMQEEGFDPGETAVLLENGLGVDGGERPPEIPPEPPAATFPSSAVAITQYVPEQVVVQTTSNVDGLLLLTDAYYQGWTVEVDDVPAPLYRANGLFRGVLLTTGEHEVRFTFAPSSYTFGRVLTLAGLFIWTALLALLLALRWRQ